MFDPFITAAELGRAFKAGTVDPVEAVELFLKRAGESKSVFILLTPERALEEAEASALRWRRHQELSPLDGVPLAWKDLFDARDTVTTAGSELFRRRSPATKDAKLVELARRLGLVFLGKTNLVEFAYSGIGINPHFGTPRNPFDEKRERVPGGSSSGSAVAVATGIAPMAMGTDTAGSIRVPAAFNGLVGFKSSSQHYPREGVFPLSPNLDSLGPIAHTVEDCLLLDALFTSSPIHAHRVALSGQRFVVDDTILEDLQIDVRSNLERTLHQLEESGAIVEKRRINFLAEVFALLDQFGWIAAPEALAMHEDLLANEETASRIDPRVRRRLESASGMKATQYIKLLWQRAKLMGRVKEELGEAVLVLPTVRHVAPELAPLVEDTELFFKVNFATLRLTMLGSFLDLPGVALPTGLDRAGMPTSMLLSLPSGEDRHLLQIALAVEEVSKIFYRMPS